MAGNEIYLGKMIEGLQVDMQSMSASLQQTVNELINIKASTAANLKTLNIQNGTGYEKIIIPATIIAPNLETKQTNAYKIFADGVLYYEIETELICGSVYTGNIFKYTLDNGATWVTVETKNSINGTLYKKYTGTISVKYGDIIRFAVTASQCTYKMLAGGKLSYSLVDLINEGALSKL